MIFIYRKVNLSVAKRSFYFTGATELNGLPTFIKLKKFFLEFSKETKDLFLNWVIRFFIGLIYTYFLYIGHAQFS